MNIREADIARLMTEMAVPGLALAVIRNARLALVAAYGTRNASQWEPVHERTIFEAASLSKPLFAYAVLQLVDAGRLSLDEPLSARLPDYVGGDPRADAITARHVLTHTTGLPNWRSDARPLRTYFAPGDRFSYSGEGFVYLQRAVERITGEPLDALADRLVFAPLRMRDSSFVWQERFESDHALPHDEAQQPGIKVKPTDANAAYSLQTTAADYARFLAAVLASTGLEAATARLWLDPFVNVPKHRFQCLDPDGPELERRVAWGLGWGLEPGPGTFFHWGSNVGAGGFAIGARGSGTAIVAFTNSENGLSIMPEIVGAVFPGARPSLDWLGYSPEQTEAPGEP
jgi:CubicO group peptidase (beta-lactamase class C family)